MDSEDPLAALRTNDPLLVGEVEPESSEVALPPDDDSEVCEPLRERSDAVCELVAELLSVSAESLDVFALLCEGGSVAESDSEEPFDEACEELHSLTLPLVLLLPHGRPTLPLTGPPRDRPIGGSVH